MKAAIFYLIMQVTLFLCFTLTQAKGESLEDELFHVAAHTGASYLITHSTEVICKKIAGQEHKLACTIVGASVAATAGVVKEIVFDKGESNKRHTIGYAEDALGIGLAVTFISIDF